MQLSRRNMLKLGIPVSLASTLRPTDVLFGQATSSALITRRIPSTGERIPAVGVNVSKWEARRPHAHAELTEVVKQLIRTGGKVIEAESPYDPASDALVGEVVAEQ